MPASGFKEMVINAQERAVSVDVNRLQKFKSLDFAEMFRYMLDVTGNDDLDAGGVIVEPNTQENPLRAEIVNGILVKPQPASLNLLVDPGVAWLINPDSTSTTSGPDDSNYKFVRDPGVTVAGTLAMTANAGGSPRVDVIECSWANATSETDTRDLFNPSTGLFAASSVTKARQASLTYRVRAGTVGGGFPGTAAGWLPLCVAMMPAGGTTVDNATFWDVRPLLSDRVFTPFAMQVSRPFIRNAIFSASTLTAATGLMDVFFNNRRIGGRLRSGSAVADADSIDLTAAANQAGTLTFTANRPWYLYLVLPFGLPRWARYTASGTRLPRSPRGIPLVAMTAPDADGNPSAALTLPTATGLGGTVSVGACVAAGHNNSVSVQKGFSGDNENGIMLYSGNGSGNNPSFSQDETIEATGATFGATPTVGARYSLTAGTHYPPNARGILVEFEVDITVAGAPTAGATIEMAVASYPPNATTNMNYATAESTTPAVGNGTYTQFRFTRWLPLQTVYPSTAAPTLQLEAVYALLGGGAGTIALANPKLHIIGWRL
jgi:hypothetical protein